MADFIDVVESSRWLIERALGGGDSDDFVNLEIKSGSTAELVAAAAVPVEASNDNILHALVNDESSYTTASPFLSKSAEIELYLLATNFLVRMSCRCRSSLSVCLFEIPFAAGRNKSLDSGE